MANKLFKYALIIGVISFFYYLSFIEILIVFISFYFIFSAHSIYREHFPKQLTLQRIKKDLDYIINNSKDIANTNGHDDDFDFVFIGETNSLELENIKQNCIKIGDEYPPKLNMYAYCDNNGLKVLKEIRKKI